jgi:hypothetical protein
LLGLNRHPQQQRQLEQFQEQVLNKMNLHHVHITIKNVQISIFLVVRRVMRAIAVTKKQEIVNHQESLKSLVMSVEQHKNQQHPVLIVQLNLVKASVPFVTFGQKKRSFIAMVAVSVELANLKIIFIVMLAMDAFCCHLNHLTGVYIVQ